MEVHGFHGPGISRQDYFLDFLRLPNFFLEQGVIRIQIHEFYSIAPSNMEESGLRVGFLDLCQAVSKSTSINPISLDRIHATHS